LIAAKDFATGTRSDMMHVYFKDLPALRASFNFYRKYFGGEPQSDAPRQSPHPWNKVELRGGITAPREWLRSEPEANRVSPTRAGRWITLASK
jgi:hypothetical protein